MAEGYGNQIHHWQAYVEASVTSETATTATITCKTYWHSISWGYSYYGHGYGVIGSTTGSDSGTVVFSSGTGASVYQLLTTMTKTVNKSASAQNVTCKGVAILTGDSTGTRNGTSTATCTVTVPAIAYETPNAPSGCSATRNSDSKATVSWTNGSTSTTKPRTATLVERSVDNGSWAQIASASSTATSYTDNGISANHRYRYRVRASNTAGKSGYSTSGYIYTTPAAPASVTASKTDASAVQVAITGAAPYASAYDVSVTTDGGATWDVIAQPSSMPYVDANAPAGTVQYRVRAVRGSLASAWTVSNQLVTITPPLAPTITTLPSNPTELGATVTVGWTPNHPDGTAQSAAQVEVTGPSGSATVYDVDGASAEYSLTPEVVGTYSARVRTKGLDPDWGAWSNSVSWGVYAPPVVVITSPASDGDTLDELPVVVTWTVTDTTGVSSQTVTLSDEGGTVYSATVGNSVRSLYIGSDVASIANLTTYSVTVRVTGGSGLAASAVREFDTDWAPPLSPTAIVQVDEDAMAANITVRSGEDSTDWVIRFDGTDAIVRDGLLTIDGTDAAIDAESTISGTDISFAARDDAPATESLMVTRIGADGSRWVVGSGLASGDTVTDPLPPLGVEYAYEVTASAETGATASVTYTEYIRSRSWALNFGAGATESFVMKYGPKLTRKPSRSGSLLHFADSGAGSGLPVWYPLSDRDESVPFEFYVLDSHEADRVCDLCVQHVGWLRDQYGHRWKGAMTPTVDYDSFGVRFRCSVEMSVVRFEEAW